LLSYFNDEDYGDILDVK